MARKYIDRPFKIKSLNSNGTFSGYASVFGELDSYRDIVIKGAFTKSIAQFAELDRKVPMLWQHRSAEPMGVYTKLEEDDHGLYVEGEINMDTQRGREGHSLMKQGAISGLSIGYDTVMFKDDGVRLVRELHEVNLWEISPVTFPAGDSARISQVKNWGELTTLAQCEEALQTMFGLSSSEATAMVSRIKSVSVAQGDLVTQPDKAKSASLASVLSSITL